MKQNRHDKILELIDRYEIETQEELAQYLKDAGYNVTQATVSRDIRQLQLSKVGGKGRKSHYTQSRQDDTSLSVKYARVLKDGYVSMAMAQNILVMKTVSGMAMAVGAAVDALHFPEVVGCIAGDDTIMIANRSVEDTVIVMEKLRTLLAQK